MKQKKQNRSAVLPLVRVTPTEKKEIQEAYLASPFPNQSAFIRAKLLDTAHELDTVEAFGEVILMGKWIKKRQNYLRIFLKISRKHSLNY